MSVLVETSAGELVIDLYCNDCPLTTKNFLKLCKMKYYNGCLFYNVQQNFIVQTGDPSGTGDEGTSVYGLMYGPQARAFEGEIRKHLKHNKIGLVSMAADSSESATPANRSQFFITLRGEDMEHLDGKHTIFGEIAEGFETLSKLNELYCDENGRPFQDVRIKHTYILDDPFDDPPQLEIPPSSPDIDRPREEKVNKRIPFEEGILDASEEGRSMAELEESIRRKEAESRAIVLEMTGDIPDAEVKPPADALFVCKLNPVTTDEDLELIFSRFGKIKECAIIRDFKTGDSLNYAFIEFETEDAVLEAYEKMNNVLIDDRRIKVDFSQSVAKLWNKYLLRPHKSKSQGDVKRPASTNDGAVGREDKKPHLLHSGASKGAGGGKDSKDRDGKDRRRSRSRDRQGGGIRHGDRRHNDGSDRHYYRREEESDRRRNSGGGHDRHISGGAKRRSRSRSRSRERKR